MRLLGLPKVMDRVPLSRSQIYTLMTRGEFPRPVKLGPKANGWVEGEIDQYIKERIAERGAG